MTLDQSTLTTRAASGRVVRVFALLNSSPTSSPPTSCNYRSEHQPLSTAEGVDVRCVMMWRCRCPKLLPPLTSSDGEFHGPRPDSSIREKIILSALGGE